jgi:deazaflavin-dependent oxidoreductase (nitroreductase family)
MSGRDWRRFGRLHGNLYRCLGGRLVGSVGLGRKVLLLTTMGRKSGVERTTPLVYMPYGEQLLVYPSNGGKETAPAWWLNLQSNPVATIQIGENKYRVRARKATDAEYQRIWPKAERYNPHWRSYASTVTRPIPLVILEGHSPPS